MHDVELGALTRARGAVERVLAGVGIRLEKRVDLATPSGFDHAVATLAAELHRRANELEVDAVRAAISVLDVDWSHTTAAQRRQLVSAALVAAGRKTALIPAQIRASFNEAAREIFDATRIHARQEQGLAIGADFNAIDRRAIAHITRSQGNFVRDELGRRLDDLGQRARQIVADGLEAGLGRAELAGYLADAARGALVNRAPFYWEVVAGSFVGRGRAFAQVSALAEAGIDRYQFQAVLDARTTPQCRFLHGRVFSVRRALGHLRAVDELDNPEDLKRISPWVRERGGQLYVRHAQGDVVLADIVRNALGTDDDVGEFRAHVNDDRLAELGALLPPLHGLCRSTIIAIG